MKFDAEETAKRVVDRTANLPLERLHPRVVDEVVLARAYLSLVAEFRKGVVAHNLPSALEAQHGGQHYKGRAIQPVEYAHANGLSFNLGSVLKYITRHREKDGLMGLKKAMHFLQFELEQVYEVRTKVEYDPAVRPLLEAVERRDSKKAEADIRHWGGGGGGSGGTRRFDEHGGGGGGRNPFSDEHAEPFKRKT